MARISRWSPWPADFWSTFGGLPREMDDLFGRRADLPGAAAGVYPAVNLYESDGGYVLTAELPGVRPEDIEISVEGERITLRGKREITYPKDERTSLHRRERQAGMFRRSIQLPVAIDPEKTDAVHRNGVLTLRVPKAPEARPRQISVHGG